MQLHLWGAIPGTGSGSGRPLELLPALHKAGPTQAAALNCSCPLKPFVLGTSKPPGISLFPVLSPATNTPGKAI